MRRIAVTGGSGFIGSNLVAHFISQGDVVANLDRHSPRDGSQLPYWRGIDIVDREAVRTAFKDFVPTHLVHLAARTDLAGRTLRDYTANMKGVENVISAALKQPGLQRLVFASSMLVCRVGYRPRSASDYAPSTAYGESKVEGEKIVRAADFSRDQHWTIVRPTSIWGPWFGEPYASFFSSILSGHFVKFRGGMSTKTFGYVGNTVQHIDALLRAPNDQIHGRTFYLGDKPPLRIDAWADTIADIAKAARPRSVPLPFVKGAALVGDALAKVGIGAPMTSFRLTNMTTDNIVDVEPIHMIAGSPRYSLEAGVRQTLAWMSLTGT